MNELEEFKKLPSWIKEMEDGSYEITIKNKKYIMQERDGSIIERCTKLSEKGIGSLEILLARESLVDPKMTDEEFSALKGSIYMKLKVAVAYVYGLNDFF